MDWTVFTSPILGLLGVLVGAGISSSTIRRTHRERLAADLKLAEQRNAAELALAERKFQFDREFAAWKRRTDLAEETLATFYEARDVIEAARSGIGFEGEGKTRQRMPGETETDTRQLDAYFRIIERLNNNAEFFAALYARRFRFLTVFGRDGAAAYDGPSNIRLEIIVAVRMLIDTYPNRQEGTLPESRRGWLAVACDFGERDIIRPRLDSAIEAMEAICGPVLREVAR